MKQKRTLYIGFKKDNGILNGGGMANRRSLNILRERFGANNVDTEYILDDSHRRSLWEKGRAAFMFLFDHHNGLTRSRVRQLVSQAQDYDYVFIATSVLGIIARALKQSGYRGTVIVHFHNIESIYYDALMPKYLPGRGIVIKSARHNDQYACQYADKIITLSRRDSDYLERHYGRKADAIIATSVPDRCPSADIAIMTSKKPACLFLGSYFAPNNEGIMWFVENVLPHVDIDLKIVGKDMGRLKAEQPLLKDVEVVGDAPDLRPYFEAADFMILPIFSGSGMKIKTCESLMYGKNIIGTDEAFEGYDLDADRVGGRCNTAQAFIDCINNYAANPVSRFNNYSREIYLTKYSEEATQAIFNTVF